MTSYFSPRKVLRQVSNRQLREFFRRRGQLNDLHWDEISETEIEQVFSSWQGLPEAERSAIQLVLQDIHELSSSSGLNVLAEEIVAKHSDRIAEFTALTSRADKAMWAYLNLPRVFAEAIVFVRADFLARGRYWITCNTLPHEPLRVTEDAKEKLRTALADFFSKVQWA